MQFLSKVHGAVENSLLEIANKHPEIFESPQDVLHTIMKSDVMDGVGIVETHEIAFQGKPIASFWVKVDCGALKASISEISFYEQIK